VWCDDGTVVYGPYSLASVKLSAACFGIRRIVDGLILVDPIDYEQAVVLYHEDLHRFALSLTHNPDDAHDLTQESYCRLLTKSEQVRDRTKLKSWLFTTLYRVFLGWKMHEQRFPHFELSGAENELPMLTPETVEKMDVDVVLEALRKIDEHHRTPLVLFYLQSLTYRQMAEILDVPIGTVMSRISRAKSVLRTLIMTRAVDAGSANVVPLPSRRRNLSESS